MDSDIPVWKGGYNYNVCSNFQLKYRAKNNNIEWYHDVLLNQRNIWKRNKNIYKNEKKKVINEQIEVSKNIYLLESIHADYGIRVNWFNLLRIYGTQKQFEQTDSSKSKLV